MQGESLNRAALAEIVFRDESARERLNAIVHPFVRQLALEREGNAKRGQIIIHVVPLLFETDYAQRCDATIMVIAPDALRVRRVLERDRWNEDQIRARMRAQIDPNEARRRATYVIENDGDLDHLRDRTEAVFKRLQSSAVA